MKFYNEQIKQAWDSWSDGYCFDVLEKIKLIKNNPRKVFPTPLWDILTQNFPTFNELKVCVPSSGDNYAAFAFYLLGAEVTSCDISRRQIENAARIAAENNWDISFKVLDSMDLSDIQDGQFDLVYTSNGVHVWISDLLQMYKEFYRILKNGGEYIMFEVHPFMRSFDDADNELKIVKPYDKVRVEGELPNFHWQMQDLVNSAIQSGFKIRSVTEMFAEKNTIGASWWNDSEWDEKSDISKNPYAALPQWISVCSEK